MERLTISHCCRSHRSPISASITRTFISLRRSRHRHGLSCTPVIENFLKLGGCSPALSGCQVCRSAHMHTIEAGSIGDERNLTQLYRGSNFVVKNVVSGPLWLLGSAWNSDCHDMQNNVAIYAKPHQFAPKPHQRSTFDPKSDAL